jgi:branched-chain amino acid transport system permease protein
MQALRTRAGWLFVVMVVAGLFLPQVLRSPYYLGLLINGLVLAVAAVGIGFLMHQCGYVMFGVAAFMGLPAYLLGIGSNMLGLNLHVAVLFAVAGSTLFALAAGALVVRARPLPFAMLTLALAQMLRSASMLRVTRPLTGGDDGLTMQFNGTFLGLTQAELGKPASFWPLAWLALCAVLALAWLASHSRFGRVLRATQSNEERMRFSGFDTYLPRLKALDFATGGHALVAMLIGGAAMVSGPVLGALLYTWGQDLFGATGYLELLTGVAVVVMIAAFPQGAMGFVRQITRRLLGKGSAKPGAESGAIPGATPGATPGALPGAPPSDQPGAVSRAAH